MKKKLYGNFIDNKANYKILFTIIYLFHLKKLFSQNIIYNFFRLKKRHLISTGKIHSIRKKNSIKKQSNSMKLIYELTPLSHTFG